MKAVFKRESFFSAPPADVFAFHERDEAIRLLTPEWSKVEFRSTASTLEPSDDVVRFSVGFFGMKFRFEMVHTVYEPPGLFVDEQRAGLFSSWRHEHRIHAGGWERSPGARLEDRIEFSHPLLFLFAPFVKHRLQSMFEHRHRVTGEEIGKTLRARGGDVPQRVAITGATGLIGRRLVQVLLERGVAVTALVRDSERAQELLGDQVTYARWDFTRPDEGDWRAALAGADSVIHLAGTPLFSQRWTDDFKREMERSRVESTAQLVEAIAGLDRKPGSFVSASALGIYGTNPTRIVSEETLPADDLLARICVNWENEARRLDEVGVRTVQARIGIVLSTESGALKEMLPIFKLGIGGPMGHAHHWINWIHLEDVVHILALAAFNTAARGPINLVAPGPVTMRGFAKAIGRVLRRPVLMRYPAGLMKLIIGEAGEYSSGGPRALGDKITGLGYRFFFDELESALANLLR
jgi:uncharacterized protein (TIGR01777 family)